MRKILFLIKKRSKDSIFNISSSKHTILVLSILVGFIITALVGYYSNKTQRDIANSLLRLHVIANSDTKEDQELKLKIRDAVISTMAPKFKLSNSIDQTKQIALNNIDNIKDAAEQVIKDNGKDYSVKVSVGNSYFPTKYYGDVVLPPGEYDALKVEIGESKGKNWWCVLFPPLCFVDATNGKLPDSSKEKLKTMLTEEEYNLVTKASGNGNVPVKIKFKSVEIWQNSKHKVEVALDNIF